MYNLYYVIFIL